MPERDDVTESQPLGEATFALMEEACRRGDGLYVIEPQAVAHAAKRRVPVTLTAMARAGVARRVVRFPRPARRTVPARSSRAGRSAPGRRRSTRTAHARSPGRSGEPDSEPPAPCPACGCLPPNGRRYCNDKCKATAKRDRRKLPRWLEELKDAQFAVVERTDSIDERLQAVGLLFAAAAAQRDLLPRLASVSREPIPEPQPAPGDWLPRVLWPEAA